MPDVLIAGRYRPVRVLGAGGMGVVWEARDERLHRSVALKVLHPRPGLSPEEAHQAEGRAMREARLTARLHHPHAVQVLDVIEHEGLPCLVLQLVPSQPLSEVVRLGASLAVEEVARLGAEVASALSAAHRLGIVHRDVKPANVLIRPDGTAVISDFGIAHALGDATLTTTGMLTGTPAYLAPEVARGQASGFASDVFSLGATLYTALEGEPPFGTDPNPMALLHRVASGGFAPPMASGALTPILLSMLAADPAERPSMEQAAAALGRVAAASPTSPVPARPHLPPTASRRRGGWVAVLAVGVLLGAVLLTTLLRPGRGDGPEGAGSPAPAASASASSGPGASAAERSATAPAVPAVPAPEGAAPSGGASASTGGSGPTSGPGPSEVTTPPSRPPTGDQLASAVTSYYALLHSGTERAWPRMTTTYQAQTAGGRAAYDRFWSGMSRVRATEVRGASPSTVTATITYYRDDGTVVRERTSFRLVEEDGVLKIARSQVLGSTTL
ncbi:MAG TPA: serine/threonine-protein kinase [Dermatophilaceae bacterium]|nr:serine/threonine-protein kinase [Dermatophilaceae bacterium]